VKVLGLLVVGYAALCLFVYLTQRSMIYHPTPPASGAPASRLTLEVDGAVLQSWVVQREGRRALIYFGGNAEDVAASAAPFAAAIPDRTLVFAHYRGYGGSTGAPSEAALVGDAIALFDHLARDHDDIAVIGRSLGSGVAVQLAALRPVGSVVLVTPFDSLVSVGQAVMPWLPVSWLAKERYDSVRAAAQVSAPVLMLVAGKDRVIPLRHARALREAFPAAQVHWVEAEEAGHNTIHAWPLYYREIAVFVR
jgi:hypothetical protein